MFNDVSSVVIVRVLFWYSNLWKPFPASDNVRVTGSSAPDASFCVALAADAASLNQLALST